MKHWSGGSKYPTEPPLAFGLHCPFGHRLPAPDDYDYASVRFIVRDDGYVKLWTVERATCTQCHPQLMDDWLTHCQRCEDGIESDLHKAGHPRFEHLPRPTGRFTFGTEVYGDTSPFAFVLHELKRMHELAWAERIIFEGDTNGVMWSTARGILAERAKVQPNRSARAITSGTTPKVKIERTDASVIAWLLANGVTPEMSGKAAWRIAGPLPGHPPRTRVFAVQPRPIEP